MHFYACILVFLVFCLGVFGITFAYHESQYVFLKNQLTDWQAWIAGLCMWLFCVLFYTNHD